MTHIYLKKNENAERRARRRASVAEINVLRKFEGSSMIEERIARQMTKLHRLWFPHRS